MSVYLYLLTLLVSLFALASLPVADVLVCVADIVAVASFAFGVHGVSVVLYIMLSQGQSLIIIFKTI